MEERDLQQEFEDQFNDVVSRLQSKQLFQSEWDIASFAVFFIFVGMVLLLVILVLIRCCCCCCCDDDKQLRGGGFLFMMESIKTIKTSMVLKDIGTNQPRRRKVGIENMALEP